MKCDKFIILYFVLIIFLVFCSKSPDHLEKEEIKNPKMNAIIQKGKELYIENGCQTCHGMTGKGDGPAGKSLKVPPRNYRDISAYKQGASVEEITNTLFTGVPGTSMAPYPHIKEKDRRAIAKLIKYFQESED